MKPILIIHLNKISLHPLFLLFEKNNYEIQTINKILQKKFKVDHNVFKKHSKYNDYVIETVEKIEDNTLIDICNDFELLEIICNVFTKKNWVIFYYKTQLDLLYPKINDFVFSHELSKKLILINHLIKKNDINIINQNSNFNQIYFDILWIINAHI